eukprot:679392-Pelagomonas_calceolata.AAC.4
MACHEACKQHGEDMWCCSMDQLVRKGSQPSISGTAFTFQDYSLRIYRKGKGYINVPAYKGSLAEA